MIAGGEAPGSPVKAVPRLPRAWRERGRLSARDFEQPGEAVLLGKQREDATGHFIGRELTGLAGATQEIEQCGVGVGKPDPGFRTASMDDSVRPNKLARQAEGAGGDLVAAGVLRREAEQIGGRNAGRKDSPVLGGKLSNLGGIGMAFSERRIAGTVINAFAETFNLALAGQAREGLRDCAHGKIAEIPQPPKPLAAGFDPAPDDPCSMPAVTGSLRPPGHK
jgi:hypothetical protein